MNIKEIREYKGLTQSELSEQTGIPRDRIAKWEQGKGAPKMDDIRKLEVIFGKNFWEDVPREGGSKIGESTPSNSRQNGDYLSKRREMKTQQAPFLVQLVPAKAMAGYVKSYDQIQFLDTLEKYGLPPGVSPVGAIWRYFEVDGESMEPNFYSGDIVLGSQVPQDDWENIRNFYTYIIITDSNAWIKRVYAQTLVDWILISENENYPPERIHITQVKELWVFRRHIKKAVPMIKKIDIEKILKDLDKNKPKP